MGKEAGSVSDRLRSHLLPLSIVPMVDIDASARLQQAVRNGQRGIACGLRCDGNLTVEIAGLDNGCRYPDSWCGVMDDDVTDFRARQPWCAHRGPPTNC